MNNKKFTYQKSGVNITLADKFVDFISKKTSKNRNRSKFKNIGGFGSVSEIPKKFKNPKIVASTDGVGTKIEIANELNKFDTLGIDLVAMCVNDLIVQGAQPLIFLDYISTNKIKLKKLKLIIKGITTGCRMAECELVGGETAEMPGTYGKDKFDLAGFSVGIVDNKSLIEKNKVKKNNIILAIPSSGVHSNGYSLIRHILKKKKIKIKKNTFLKKELMRPTKIYVKEVLKLNEKKLINGCANITGGGIIDNIKRVIPNGLCADIDLSKIKVKKIFKWIKNQNVDELEMLRTFNCGVGFCLITDKKNLKNIYKFFSNEFKPYPIGKIVAGKIKAKFNDKISW